MSERSSKQKLNSPGARVSAAVVLANKSSLVNHTPMPDLLGGACTEHAKFRIQSAAKTWNKLRVKPVILHFVDDCYTNWVTQHFYVRNLNLSLWWENWASTKILQNLAVSSLHFSQSLSLCGQWRETSETVSYLSIPAGNHVGWQLDELAAFWANVRCLNREEPQWVNLDSMSSSRFSWMVLIYNSLSVPKSNVRCQKPHKK